MNGTAQIPVENLTVGDHIVEVRYSGDGNHTSSSNFTEFTVNKVTSDIKANNVEIVEGNTAEITVNVPEDATGVVLVTIDGKKYFGEIESGQAKVSVEGLKEGDYTATVTYPGNDKYAIAETEAKVTVVAPEPVPEPVKPTVNVTVPGDAEVGDTPVVNVTLPANATGNVTVLVDGREIANVPVVNGTAQVPLENLSAGDHVVEVRYSGDDNYAPSSNSTELTVSKVDPDVKADAEVSTEGETAVITVDVPDDATGVVLVDVGGKKYYGDIKDGKAVVEVDGLKAGNYTATVTYLGDDKYGTASTSVPVVVKAVEPVPEPVVPSMNVTMPEDSKVGDTPVVSVELPEDATGNVSVLVDGREVANVPVVNGTAQIPLDDLSAGDHAVEVKYSGDDKYAPTSESGNLSVDKLAPNMDVDVNDTKEGNDAVITVDVPEDATGVALIDIDGVGYYAPIKDGKATVSVSDLKEGAHSVTATFPGDGKYANESVTKSFNVTKDKKPIATVIVIDPTFTRNATDYYAGERGGYIYGILMDTDGNRLANKVVQVAVNGPVYNITTDENGLIPVQINLMNANVYTYALFFQGDADYNASHIASSKLTIIKKTTSIKASNKSFKATAKTKTVKVTLKTIKNAIDGKTYLKAGKKITLKVNGKTYKAKTDGNGVAKFNIKLTKKGKFTAKVKFNGSKTYEASSKSIKITIK